MDKAILYHNKQIKFMKYIKIIFAFFIFTNLSFGQLKSPFLINNELFELPGKWKVNGHLESSGQYSISNKKLNLGLLISVRKIEGFDFYSKDLTEFEFLNKFYIWEPEYWAKDGGEKVEIEKIEINEAEKYIIWKIVLINKNIENYIFSGVRNGKLILIDFIDNKKAPKSKEEKIEFLKNIYLKK